MSIRAVADTHTVTWYVFGDARLSPVAWAAIEDAALAGDHIGISSITLAEIIYLQERRRVDPSTLARLLFELDRADAVLIEVPFDRGMALALQLVDRAQVPDMPDRIIAAIAVAARVPAISRDGCIRLSSVPTIW